eukprot:gb/GECG01005135.1/.p1 GENE.gb/GECG01005135.1/~~gb/GECG01005135.1/.p1  ORF type:complete len:302 (+),score=30.55 gb/GECG01005135.1/:1-906(+)
MSDEDHNAHATGDEPPQSPTSGQEDNIPPMPPSREAQTPAQQRNNAKSSAGRGGSHEDILKSSQMYHVLSWKDPQLSGIVLFLCISFYFFYSVMAWTVPKLAAVFLTLILTGNGLLKILNRIRQDPTVELVTIPTSRDTAQGLGKRVIELAVGQAERFNSILNWSDMRKSSRFLSLSFLAAECSFLMEPTPVFCLVVLAFAAAPAYRFYGNEAVNVYDQNVEPVLQQAFKEINDKREFAVREVSRRSRNVLIASASGLGVVVFLLWQYLIPLRVILTMTAIGYLVIDLVSSCTVPSAKKQQ